MISVSMKIKDLYTVNDPKITGATRITGFVNVMDIPFRKETDAFADELTKILSKYPIPPFPNPRLPDDKLSTQDKKVRDSLENINVDNCEINNFHAKNKGVTLVINSIKLNFIATNNLSPEETRDN